MTRADFYVGTGTNAKYLGSIFSDGGTVPNSIKRARTPEKFEKAVAKYIKKENGSTQWPWPWETSVTTDFSYWLEDEKLYVLDFGKGVKIIEKKRGRPAAFDRTFEMPVFVPPKNCIPDMAIHSYVEPVGQHPMSLSIEQIQGAVLETTLPDDATVRQTKEGTND